MTEQPTPHDYDEDTLHTLDHMSGLTRSARSWAVCSCGWESDDHSTDDAARAEHDQHRADEAAKITTR